jgi:outer membrane protein OmpA-like peptidoglycan-associated protein
MVPKKWYLTGVGVVVVLALGNLWLAWDSYRMKSPLLVVTASHEIPPNHKVALLDLSFAILRTADLDGAVGRPQEAVGACSVVTIKESQPVKWDQLMPLGTGDDTCASAAIVLRVLERITGLSNTSATAPSTTAPSAIAESTHEAFPIVAPLQQWMDILNMPPELSPATRSALGDFRGEFTKEFAKRVADNAADHVFGRDRKEAVTTPPSPPKTSTSQVPTPLELVRIIYFDVDRAVLSPDEHQLLMQFAAKLLQEKTCRVMIHAYADRTGQQRHNMWLSWKRGNTVAGVLIASGIDRRIITVVPHGYEEPAVDLVTGTPNVLARRVETYGNCLRV